VASNSRAIPSADDQRYLLDCAPATNRTECSLHQPRGMLGTPVPPVARFGPEAVSATRIADSESPWVAFRVPETANAPASGIWQYVDTVGQGVTLDVRPDAIAVGVFGYDDAGAASWSLAVGALDTDTMAADLLEFRGGSCLGCAYTSPNVARASDFHIEFVDSTRAWLTLGDDAPRAITLLPFGDNYFDRPIAGDPDTDDFGPQAVPALIGGWISTVPAADASSSPDTSDAIRFDVGQVQSEIDNGGISHLVARGGLPTSPIGGTPSMLIECIANGSTPRSSCELTLEGTGGTPPAPPLALGTFLPQDIAPMRISGIASDDTPLYLFRIPAMYNAPTQ
jgi:hypothetical protein